MKAEYKAMKTKYLSEAFAVHLWEEEDDWLEDLRFILYIWLGTVCLEGWLKSITEISFSVSITFLAAFFVTCITYLIETEMTKTFSFLPYIVTGIISACLLAFTPLHEGLAGIFYDMHKTFASRGILFPFTGTCTESVLLKTGSMVMVGCFLLLAIRVFMVRMRIPAFLLPVLYLIFELFFGNWEGVLWFLLWIIWLIIPMVSNLRAYLFVMVPPLLIFGILFVITGGNHGAEWMERWNNYRYHINDEILPQGDLSKAGTMNRSSDTALKVKGSNGEYYYLQGFVGTIFQENCWGNDSQMLQDFEAGINSNQSDFLQSLHAAGYSGWNQISDETDIKKQNVLEIENKDAATRYVYVPYEMVTTANQIEESRIGVFSNAESLLANGIVGKKNYQIRTKSSLAGTESIIIPSTSENNISLYSSYAEYVNRTCLTLSKKQKSELSELLGKTKIVGNDDPFPVIQKIRTWLKDNMTYNKTPGAVSPDMDFFDWFTNHRQQGYDVHYATIAVLMFRYYGIPSRYVEGYLVTGKNEISQKFAHAWPEIYLPDYGWIPVEVMSGYQKIMPSYFAEDGGTAVTTDTDSEGEDTEQTTEQTTEISTEIISQDTEQTTEQSGEDTEISEESTSADHQSSGISDADSQEDHNSFVSLIKHGLNLLKRNIVFILLFFLLMIFIVVIIFITMKEKYHKKRLLESKYPKIRVVSWYRYCVYLIYALETDPIRKRQMEKDNRVEQWQIWWKEMHPSMNEKLLQEAVMLRQKAIYSESKIQWQEAKPVIAFYRKEYKYFYRQLGLKSKIRMALGLYHMVSCQNK